MSGFVRSMCCFRGDSFDEHEILSESVGMLGHDGITGKTALSNQTILGSWTHCQDFL